MECLIIWIQNNLALVQAITGAITAIVAMVAIIISAYNTWQFKIHSSPKPFIELEYVHVGSYIPVKTSAMDKVSERQTVNTEQDLSPTVALINIGKGVAIDVEVYVNANTKSGKSMKVRLEGPSVLPDVPTNYKEKYIAKYDSIRKDLLLPHVLEVSIEYKSDSGYKRKTVWEYQKDERGTEPIKLKYSN